LRIDSSRFVRAATQPQDEPRAAGPDVVVLGRSNVGKSSLINSLLGAKNLARTSSEPGRTRTVNFYRVNEAWNVVDLPGYGYAKVPEAVRRSWKPLVEGFLARRRERIALALLVVDARHEASDLDLAMREWLEAGGVPYLVVATKSDKLSAAGRAAARRVLAAAYGEAPGGAPPLMVSVRTGEGLREVWKHLDAALRRS
jgi:GTP-binding protein